MKECTFQEYGCWSRSLGNPHVIVLSVIYMGWMQAGCSDREELSVLEHLSCTFLVTLWKLIFTTLKNVLRMLYFVQTLCLYGEENANCHSGFFVAFHAIYAGYFLFEVKLWSLLKLKFSGLGLLPSWDACPLQVLLLLAFLRLLSFLSCLHIFLLTSFPWTFLEISREVEGFADIEENEIIKEKKHCPRVVPDSPELGQ